MRALLLFVLFAAIQLLAALLSRLATGTQSPTAVGTSLLLCEGTLAAALWFWFKKEQQKRDTSTQHAAEDIPVLGTGIRSLPARQGFSILAAVLLAFGLSLLLDPLHLPDDGTQALFDGMKQNAWCLLLLCLIGPLCEELVFRAGILRSLRRQGLPGWLAAGISALSFAFIHGNLVQGIPAFIIGCVLGLFYLRTNSLALCLPAHIANNVFAVVLLFFPHLTHFTSLWPASAVVALGLLHFGLGILNVWRALR